MKSAGEINEGGADLAAWFGRHGGNEWMATTAPDPGRDRRSRYRDEIFSRSFVWPSCVPAARRHENPRSRHHRHFEHPVIREKQDGR